MNSHPEATGGGNSSFDMSTNTVTAAVDAGRSPIDWGAAFAQHQHWLRTVIRHRLGEESPVDDVLQEVALASSKSTNQPTDAAKVAPWLYRVAIKQCLFYRRTRGRRRKFEDRYSADVAAEPHATTNPLDWLMAEERLAAIRDSLARLPELDREVLILKYTENWTYRELAQHLGVSVHAVEHRLIKARQRLRSMLSNAGI